MFFKLGLFYKWLDGKVVKTRTVLIFPDRTWGCSTEFELFH